MITGHEKFDVFVFFFVMLAGIAFGALAGHVYSSSYWWVGMLTGGVSSFFLAVWYLKQLAKGSAKGHSKIRIGFTGILLGIICGIICTALIHGTMLLFADVPKLLQPDELFSDGILGVILTTGGIMGVASGFLIGVIFSTIYVSLPEDDRSETA